MRRKIVALLVAASLIPLGTSAILQVREARSRMRATTTELLAARADQLRHQIEAFHLGHELAFSKLARLPVMAARCLASAAQAEALTLQVREIFAIHVDADRDLLAVGLLDRTGKVVVATRPRLEAQAMAELAYVGEALRGSAATSDVHLGGPVLDDTPAIAVATPVRGEDGVVGVVVVWIRASTLWDLARASNGLAGDGSFAVVADELGIRIAHSYDDDVVFRPSAALAPATVERLVRERRFGASTRRWLAEVRPVPELFERATAPYPDTAVFHARAPVNQQANYGVARRLSTARWTVFYLTPDDAVERQLSAMTRDQEALAVIIMIVAFVVGLALATLILRPVARLSDATRRISAGDLSARVPPSANRDELTRLCASFNAMAERIERDDAALRRSHDELEHRVAERTAALVAASHTEARARAALEVSTARLEVLSRTAHELAAVSGDDAVVLQLTARRLGELVGEACAIRMVSEDGAWLEPSSTYYFPDPVRRAGVGQVLGSARAAVGDGIGGRVAASGEAMLIPDVTAPAIVEMLDQVPAFRDLLVQLGVTSLLTLPLRSRERTIGVVSLMRSAPHSSYTLDDQRFAQELADRAGLAIDNAVLVATLERRVEARTAALEAANHELEAFSYSVSHDLRAPLRAIDGFSQILLGDHAAQLDAEGRRYLQRVRAATQRMATLIDDLLNLARITRTHLRWAPVDLSALADQVVGELRRRDPARTTVVHIAPGVASRGDARLLTIVLENLLGNAWKFTAKHPAAEIWFGQQPHDGRTAFFVRDTGSGFDMQQADKLFLPFQRLHAASDYEGAGIGLATVQRIVTRHNGSIWAEAAIEEGATFFVALGDQP